MNCLQCGTETTNDKFCNRSCAATYNNTHKKLKQHNKICKTCGTKFTVGWNKKARTNCDKCTKNRAYITKAYDINKDKTIAEIKSEHTNKHSRPWTDRIRGYARQQHSNKTSCVNCGYSLHVEICHKKAIVDFPETATIREVNHSNNIACLCRNCHWEFDNGHLELD